MNLLRMKRIKSCTVLLVFLCVSSCAPYQVQKSKSTQQALQTHRVIAILPFDVGLAGGHAPNGLTYSDFRKQLHTKGYELQTIIYNHFQQNSGVTKLLTLETTNRILSDMGLTPDKIARFPKDELCSRLGVDAVVVGRSLTKQAQRNMSAVSSIAILTFTGFIVVGNAKTTETNFDVRIHDKTIPDYIWRCTAVIKSGKQIQQFVNQSLTAILPYNSVSSDRSKVNTGE